MENVFIPTKYDNAHGILMFIESVYIYKKNHFNYFERQSG